MARRKAPPGYVETCTECYMLGEACPTHAVGRADNAGKASALRELVEHLSKPEALGTFKGRLRSRTLNSLFAAHGGDRDTVANIERIIAGAQREDEGAGDGYGGQAAVLIAALGDGDETGVQESDQGEPPPDGPESPRQASEEPRG